MKRLERGFTLVEIMIVVAIIALLAAIAIPNVLRGRVAANESAAIGNLRALVSSLEMFRSTNQVYPNPWQGQMYNYANPAFGPPSFNFNMTASNAQGYTYTYTALATNTAYNIVSVPVTLARTGTRSFYVDESGVIRHCLGNTSPTTANNTIDLPPNAACP